MLEQLAHSNDEKQKMIQNSKALIKFIGHLSVGDAISALRNSAILLEAKVDKNKEIFMAESLVSDVTN